MSEKESKENAVAVTVDDNGNFVIVTANGESLTLNRHQVINVNKGISAAKQIAKQKRQMAEILTNVDTYVSSFGEEFTAKLRAKIALPPKS